MTTSSTSPSSGLKLKLRGIQAALKEWDERQNSSPSSSPSSSRLARKRTINDINSDTDSEIDIMPPSRKIAKAAKRVKVTHSESDHDDDDAMFDTSKLVLSSNVLKRSERMLDPTNLEDAKLIAAAPKIGSDYYDSDADEVSGKANQANKPQLFRKVKWGSLATNYNDPSVFPKEPEFTQFVPGRYERLPDNTASDQKQKLLIRFTDSTGRQRIFTNPPPVDWNDQAAITALNKRTVQQIRRNTAVRFREVVEPYVEMERKWILEHLEQGKPKGGWKKFVDGFNETFEGVEIEGAKGLRPKRSHSSLTKEVERFGKEYAKGKVPKGKAFTGKGKGKGKGKAE